MVRLRGVLPVLLALSAQALARPSDRANAPSAVSPPAARPSPLQRELRELKGALASLPAVKTARRTAQVAEIMAATSALARKVVGGEYQAEAQRLLSAAARKRYSKEAHLRAVDCGQAHSDAMALYGVSFCDAQSEDPGCSENCDARTACGSDTDGDGASLDCYHWVTGWGKSIAGDVCSGVMTGQEGSSYEDNYETARASVTAACKAALGIPCAATAPVQDSDCTAEALNDQGWMADAAKLQKMCSTTGSASDTSCGEDGYVAKLLRMTKLYAGEGVSAKITAHNRNLQTVSLACFRCTDDGSDPVYVSVQATAL